MVAKIASFVLGGAIAAQLLPVVQSGNWVQILILGSTIVGTGWKLNSQLKKIHQKTFLMSMEHEMVMEWYVKEHPNQYESIDDLPTRRAARQAAGNN